VAPVVVAPVAPPLSASADFKASTPSEQHAAATPSSTVIAHPAIKPAARRVGVPRMVSKPKPQPAAPEPSATDAPASATDPNPYVDPAEHAQPKTPTAAFKEQSSVPVATTAPAESSAPKTPTAPKAPIPKIASGLEDSASPVRPAPSATPGF
jgi:hypothetical protein